MAIIPNHIWHKIAGSMAEIKFSANGLTEIKINDKTICIANHNNHLFACTQKCPHAGAVLAEGYIDAVGNIVCPLHKYKYDLKSGRNISGEGYFLKTFLIEERKEGIFICLESPAFLDKEI